MTRAYSTEENVIIGLRNTVFFASLAEKYSDAQPVARRYVVLMEEHSQDNGRYIRITAAEGDTGERADKFLAATHGGGFSRERIKAAIAAGAVTFTEESGGEGVLSSPKEKIRAGVIYFIDREKAFPGRAEDAGAGGGRLSAEHSPPLPLDVLYEDEWLVVINKPKGMTVHPGAGTGNDTLAHALLQRYAGADLPTGNGADRPGIVHRLDRDTSGVMTAARTEEALSRLARMIADREVSRIYHIICKGAPAPRAGVIDAPIARHPVNRTAMHVPRDPGKNAKRAVTRYKTLRVLAGGALSLIECRLETGRTHQIRVHMRHIGCLPAGDGVYGITAPPAALDVPVKEAFAALNGQALHAAELAFVHPFTGEALTFSAPYPPDIARLAACIG